MPRNQRLTRKSVRNEVVRPLVYMIFSNKCSRAVFPVMGDVHDRESPQTGDLDGLQMPEPFRGQVFGPLQQRQVFPEYSAVAPATILGALYGCAYVLQGNRQRGIKLLQHFQSAV